MAGDRGVGRRRQLNGQAPVEQPPVGHEPVAQAPDAHEGIAGPATDAANVEYCFESFFDPHFGQGGFPADDRTRISHDSPHAAHVYS
jgi:hypothetical protein